MIEHVVVLILFVIVVVGALSAPTLSRLVKERDEFARLFNRATDAHRWLSELDSELEPLWQYLFETTYVKTFPKDDHADEMALTLYHVATIDEAREKIRKARREREMRDRHVYMAQGASVAFLALGRRDFERLVAVHFLTMIDDEKLVIPNIEALASDLRCAVERENLAVWNADQNDKIVNKGVPFDAFCSVCGARFYKSGGHICSDGRLKVYDAVSEVKQ